MSGRVKVRGTLLLALALVAAGGRVARAQAFSRLGPGEQAVTAETGVQAGWSPRWGMWRGWRWGARGGR
jgi:hypothetical protein